MSKRSGGGISIGTILMLVFLWNALFDDDTDTAKKVTVKATDKPEIQETIKEVKDNLKDAIEMAKDQAVKTFEEQKKEIEEKKKEEQVTVEKIQPPTEDPEKIPEKGMKKI